MSNPVSKIAIYTPAQNLLPVSLFFPTILSEPSHNTTFCIGGLLTFHEIVHPHICQYLHSSLQVLLTLDYGSELVARVLVDKLSTYCHHFSHGQLCFLVISIQHVSVHFFYNKWNSCHMFLESQRKFAHLYLKLKNTFLRF